MFIKFIDASGTEVRLNPAHVVSIETPMPLSGIQGGVQKMRIYATEGRVFTIEKKYHEFVIGQIDCADCKEPESGQDKNSPV